MSFHILHASGVFRITSRKIAFVTLSHEHKDDAKLQKEGYNVTKWYETSRK